MNMPSTDFATYHMLHMSCTSIATSTIKNLDRCNDLRIYLSFGYKDSYVGGLLDCLLLLDFVALVTVVPVLGMILNGPIFFKTSDLNSMISYVFGISVSVSVYLV